MPRFIHKLREHDVLAFTAEGLLVLSHVRKPHATVCLLSPLTRHLTGLSALTMLPLK
jgi:hypothetical protein